MIWEKLITTQNQQKNYVDWRRRPLEFEESEHVSLRVLPTTGVNKALKTRKLCTRFHGPFQILNKVRPIAYQLALTPNLSNLHDVFHLSQSRKYCPSPSHVL